MVVIAGIGLTIIMGWMSSISAPKAIGDIYVSPGQIVVFDGDGDGLYATYDLSITVTVTDQAGDRLEGATVLLEGSNVKLSSGEPVRGITDRHGQVQFTGVCIEQFGSSMSLVTVTVAKGDYGIDSSYEIPVVPG